MSLKFIASLLLVVFINGCGQGPSQTASSSKAYVKVNQALKAFKVVESIDYLPFNYKEDGCYGRALYMAMELAAEKIPVSSQYAFGHLQPTNTIAWRYHVAPMLVTSPDPETELKQDYYSHVFGTTKDLLESSPVSNTKVIILDPSMFKGPVSRGRWIEGLNGQGSLNLVATPGNNFSPSSAFKFANKDLIRNFDELGQFKLQDIVYSCQVLSTYINREDLTRAEKQAKINKIFRRTEELVNALGQPEIDKLDYRLNKIKYEGQCNFSVTGWSL